MATSAAGKTMECLKTILDGVSGLSPARVKLGLADFEPSEEFFLGIIDDGPFVMISTADFGDSRLQTRDYDFDIEISMWYGQEANLDQDYLDMVDLVSAMHDAIRDSTAYTNGACFPNRNISITKDEEANLNPRVVLHKFKLGFWGI